MPKIAWRRLMVLVFVMALVPLAQEPTADETAFQEILAAGTVTKSNNSGAKPEFKREDAAKAQKASRQCEEFVTRFPSSPRVPDALHVIGLFSRYEDNARLALDRLRKEYPSEFEGRALSELYRVKAGVTFSEVAAPRLPGRAVQLTKRGGWHTYPGPLGESGQPLTDFVAPRAPYESKATIYRIPSAHYEAAMRDTSTLLSEEECAATVPAEKWERLFEETIAGLDTPMSVSSKEFSRPGWYVIDEEVLGFHQSTRFRIASIEPHWQTAGPDLVIAVCDRATGDSIRDFKVIVGGETKQSGADGLVRFALKGPGHAVLERGDELIRFPVESASASTQSELIHVVTDRPLYRPGHTVRYKAIHRDWAAAKLSRPAGRPYVVEVRDPEGRVLQKDEGRWNAMGSCSGSFVLAEEPRLGRYAIVVKMAMEPKEEEYGEYRSETRNGSASFDVLAYSKPEFKVAVEPWGATPYRGQPIRARVEARYYFGAPVVGAKVTWSAHAVWSWTNSFSRFTSNEYRPQLPYGDPDEWFYRRPEDDHSWSYDSGETMQGEAQTGSEGSVVIDVPTDEHGWGRDWEINVVVQDASGREVEGTGRVSLKRADLEISCGTAETWVLVGEPIEIRGRIEAAGSGRLDGREVEVTVFRYREEFGYQGNESSGVLILLPERMEKVTTDSEGRIALKTSFRASGRVGYRLKSLDDSEREAESWGEILVVDPSRPVDQETWTGNSIAILPERLSYPGGATARVLVQCKAPPAEVFFTTCSAGVVDARWITLQQQEQVIDVPLPQRGPNVYLAIQGMIDGHPTEAAVEVAVVPDSQILKVDVRVERDTFSPRDQARLVVTTTRNGQPVAAEVELALVDRAVLALKRDRSRSLATFFQPWHEIPQNVQRDLTFRPRDGNYVSIAFAVYSEPPTEAGDAPLTRRFFPDTWHWDATLMTGADGKASVELTVPDSLTQWRVLARAVEGDDGFGQAETSVAVTQDVVLRLITPRFYVQGDHGTVSTFLHSERAGKFTVRLAATGGKVSPAEREVTVAAGGVAELEWEFEPTKSGEVTIEASACGDEGADAIAVTLPVHANEIPIEQGISGQVRPRWSGQIDLPAGIPAGEAWLDVYVASASSLSMVEEALPYLADFPYGCTEQTMSRFLPTLVAHRAAKRLNLPLSAALERDLPQMLSQGLQRLYGFQHRDGGWGWWTDDETHMWMTTYVLHGLLVARASGVEVDPGTLQRGMQRLANEHDSSYALYVRHLAGEDVANRVQNFEPQSDLDRAMLVLSGRTALAADLSNSPPGTVTGNSVYQLAWVLRAMASVDPKDTRIDRLLYWLALNRTNRRWVSTLDTAHVIYALTEFSTGHEDPPAVVVVNGKEVSLDRRHARVPALAGRNTVDVSQTGDERLAASCVLHFPIHDDPAMDPNSALEVVRVVRVGDVAIAPGSVLVTGQDVMVEVTVTARRAVPFILIECPIPAGSEVREIEGVDGTFSRFETRDDRVSAAVGNLDEGQSCTLRIRLRATQHGAYTMRPATAGSMYDPSLSGRATREVLRVGGR